MWSQKAAAQKVFVYLQKQHKRIKQEIHYEHGRKNIAQGALHTCLSLCIVFNKINLSGFKIYFTVKKTNQTKHCNTGLIFTDMYRSKPPVNFFPSERNGNDSHCEWWPCTSTIFS